MEKKKKSEGKLKGWISKHKKLSAIIASVFLILCVAAIIVVVALANKSPDNDENNNSKPSYNPITENADSVVYYYNVPSGDILLTLRKGWYFTLEGPNINKSGEYTLSGNEITLDFVRDKDGVATAVMNGNDLSVSNILPDSTDAAIFKLMVSYTVSFETNGGSAVSNVTVVNGKTIGEPAAPTKANSTFAGWYTDAGCTIAFRFNADQVAKDTVLYAKWTDASQSTP